MMSFWVFVHTEPSAPLRAPCLWTGRTRPNTRQFSQVRNQQGEMTFRIISSSAVVQGQKTWVGIFNPSMSQPLTPRVYSPPRHPVHVISPRVQARGRSPISWARRGRRTTLYSKPVKFHKSPCPWLPMSLIRHHIVTVDGL